MKIIPRLKPREGAQRVHVGAYNEGVRASTLEIISRRLSLSGCNGNRNMLQLSPSRLRETALEKGEGRVSTNARLCPWRLRYVNSTYLELLNVNSD